MPRGKSPFTYIHRRVGIAYAAFTVWDIRYHGQHIGWMTRQRKEDAWIAVSKWDGSSPQVKRGKAFPHRDEVAYYFAKKQGVV